MHHTVEGIREAVACLSEELLHAEQAGGAFDGEDELKRRLGAV